jgi:NhaP-type Na+/H+ or K+/H+ antiporter/mannitol/fructose-specific phosphotransferase system IIA component (Ntr-type)
MMLETGNLFLAAAEGGGSHQMVGTFAGALAFGVLFVIIAHRIGVSAIVVLLIGGIAVGPEGLGLVNPAHLGDGLATIISLAVGLILFEGGLTLDPKGYREASSAIKGVLTKGVLLTWLGSTVAVQYIFGFPIEFSLLAASLIIVTGPTVIAPLLKRIHVRGKLHSILHWEGVLIDPIGVFIALLCYEWIITGGRYALAGFAVRFAIGLAVGAIAGIIISEILKRGWVPDESLNIFVVAAALAVFAGSDLTLSESGLLSVTVAGFVVGYRCDEEIAGLKIYKAELIELLIGLLFVLLAANLDINSFRQYGPKLLLLVAVIMFVVRPLNIFASTIGSDLETEEKLFLSWVAPRGIVAASMASLFALTLRNGEFGEVSEHAAFLETFTYSVIAGTVIFQGFTAKAVGGWLGVLELKPKGWLVIGAHSLGRRIAAFLKSHGQSVVLMDTNARDATLARRNDFTVVLGNALTLDPEDYLELYEVGNVLAITDNEDLNTLICQRWRTNLKNANLFRWASYSTDDPSATAVESLHVGTPVWPYHDLTKVLAQDENPEVVAREYKSRSIGSVQNPDEVLMALMEDEVMPFLPPVDGETKCAMLVLPTYDSVLHVNTLPDWMMVSDHDTIGLVMEALIARLKNVHDQIDDVALLANLEEREIEFSSLIGYGIALPHTYSDKLATTCVMIAKMMEPLADSHTGEPVEYVFLVVSPSDEPKAHLHALSEISHFITNDENRERLAAAHTAKELVDVFFSETPSA